MAKPEEMYIVIYCEDDTHHDVASSERGLLKILDRYIRKARPMCMTAGDTIHYLEDVKVIHVFTRQRKKTARSYQATELVTAVQSGWQLELLRTYAH